MTTMQQRREVYNQLITQPTQPLSEDFLKKQDYTITKKSIQLQGFFEKCVSEVMFEQVKCLNKITHFYITVFLTSHHLPTVNVLRRAGFANLNNLDRIMIASAVYDLNVLVALLEFSRGNTLNLIQYQETDIVDFVSNAVRKPTGQAFLELDPTYPLYVAEPYMREYFWNKSYYQDAVNGAFTIEGCVYDGTYIVKILRNGHERGRWQGKKVFDITRIFHEGHYDSGFASLIFNIILSGKIDFSKLTYKDISPATTEVDNRDLATKVKELLDNKALDEKTLAKALYFLTTTYLQTQ